jgi:hypothetical protein
MAAFKLKAQVPLEKDEAEWLLDWARTQRHRGKPLSDYLLMSANGAVLAGDAKHRAIQMARMKRQGFKAGVFDYFLPIPKGADHGLFLELKRTRGGVVSEDQEKFRALVQDHYATAICKGWEAAMLAIKSYLLQP